MKYVALLRGIEPGNPNMTNDKLRSVFEELGYVNVRSVISSGNILFESDETDTSAIENKIQIALQQQLGIAGGTIIRSNRQMQSALAQHPFQSTVHGRESYLTVTFLKHPYKQTVPIPYVSENGYRLLSYDKDANALYCVTDTTKEKTPNLMIWLERQYGKDITTRTLKTVERIYTKMK